MIGQRLLHYEILEKIGEGGMGVVYKALDTHLDRPVAIKVLPPGQTADPERKRRFVQEAKAASALRHPNIVVIHDIASDRGVDFIVMELVEGATLDRLIGRRALRLSEALATAVQVADGLARAHAAGIVHRDLKPTNIMVTADGHAKILDFGLAKLLDPPSGPAVQQIQATETLPRDEHRTEDGVILGTAAYMAPEQAEGRPADHRADVFAFGAVLYEMLAGRKAFARGSRVATLSAVLRDDPEPLHKLNEAVPAEVETVVQRCLRKDPQRRWQTMSDLKVVLQDLKEDSESGRLQASRAAAPLRKKRHIVPLAAAALVMIAATAVVVRTIGRRAAAPASFVDRRLTYDSGLTTTPALSPDGSLFAYASDRESADNLDLWIQQVNGGRPIRLTNHPADDMSPSFSPDGSKIAFFSRRDGGGIYMIDALGGEMQGGQARRLAPGLSSPQYSPDGRWIACIRLVPDNSMATIVLLPLAGGAARDFLPDYSVQAAGQGAQVVWSPDGERLLFAGRRVGPPAESGWWSAPVDGGDPVPLNLQNLNFPTNVMYFPCGWLGEWVYFLYGTTIEGVNIYRAGIDERARILRGPAEAITTGPGMKFWASIGRTGDILFADMKAVLGAWSLPARADEGLVTGAPVPLGRDILVKTNPAVSRDGRRIAFAFFGGVRAANDGIRLVNTAEGRESTIPLQGSSFASRPRLSRDGSVLAYRDTIGTASAYFLLPDGAAAPRELCRSCEVLDFFSDPAFVLVRDAPGRLVRMDVRSGEARPAFESEEGRIVEAAVSPDDRRLAVLVFRPDRRMTLRIVPAEPGPPQTAPAPKPAAPMREDDSFLTSVNWSPDGRLLYYMSEMDGTCAVYAQELDPGGLRPVGEPRKVFSSPQARYQLNMPYGGARLGVARDRLVLSVDDVTGNIFLTQPARNR